jgi:zinc D-Ala-D-Ala carboxypeptidase
MNISPHFNYKEFVHTDHNQFSQENYEQGKQFIGNMRMLALFYLEPIRARFGFPMHITSCFRCADLNEFIGGSKTSQHPRAEAVDFIIKNTDCRKVFDYIRIKDCFKYGQLIWEKNKTIEWIHLSLPTLDVNMQNLIFENGIYRRIK